MYSYLNSATFCGIRTGRIWIHHVPPRVWLYLGAITHLSSWSQRCCLRSIVMAAEEQNWGTRGMCQRRKKNRKNILNIQELEESKNIWSRFHNRQALLKVLKMYAWKLGWQILSLFTAGEEQSLTRKADESALADPPRGALGTKFPGLRERCCHPCCSRAALTLRGWVTKAPKGWLRFLLCTLKGKMAFFLFSGLF